MTNSTTFAEDSAQQSGPQNAHLGLYIGLGAGLSLLAAIVAAIVVLFFVTPTYRATATLQIETKPSSILDVDQVLGDPQQFSAGYYATQYEILRSRHLATQAVESIDWDKYPHFLDDDQEAEDAGPDAIKVSKQRALVDKFRDQTVIQPVIPTLVVRVHFISENRDLATEAANALTDAYIKSGYQEKLQTAERATHWISDRLGSVSKQLQDSQQALQDYREKKNIVPTENGRNLQDADLAANMQQLREAKRTETELENTYNKVRQANGRLQALEAIPALIDRNTAAQKAQSAYASAGQQYVDMQSRYGPQNPKVTGAKAALEQARSSYTQQLSNAAAGVKAQYQIAAQNVRSLEKNVQNSRENTQQQGRDTYKLQVLNRDVDSSQQLYDTLLQKFKATQAEGEFESLRARVIDPAVIPIQKYGPHFLRWVLLAAIAGGLAGLLLAGLISSLEASRRKRPA